MKADKPEVASALVEFEAVRVPGGVLLRVELGGAKASGVISTEDARRMASALKNTAAALPVPPQPKAGSR